MKCLSSVYEIKGRDSWMNDNDPIAHLQHPDFNRLPQGFGQPRWMSRGIMEKMASAMQDFYGSNYFYHKVSVGLFKKNDGTLITETIANTSDIYNSIGINIYFNVITKLKDELAE